MVCPRSSRIAAACLVLAAVTAACTSNNNNSPTPAAPTCSYSITQPATTTFAAEGGTGSVTITAASGCAWTATSSAAFLTITQGATGSSNGTVAFTVAPNTGADRTATLAVAGTNITITQRAPSVTPPTGTLAAPTANAPIGGVFVDPGRPALVVNNAASTGNVGTVTYRFEISDVSTFPSDPVRTFTQDGVAQGSGTTSWVVNHDLGPSVLWYWHARATNGVTTSAYSATETFSTGTPCTFTLSPTNVSVNGAAGTGTITVTTGSACTWTATSNSSFITVSAGASGVGSGTVTYNIAANTGAARTGTVTVAGQSFIVSQAAGGGVVASFQMFDLSSQGGATTDCRFRNATAQPTTCTLQSTSFTLGTNTIVSYSWTVTYTYDTVKTITGTNSTLAITDQCGGATSTTDGVAQPLSVTLTVTDSLGATTSATSGIGSQPPLQVRLYACGS